MSWFVLIGGESLEEQGSNLLKRQFLHTSLNFIGQAYDNLRSSGVKKDNIIIIAQLEDYLRSPHVTIDSYPYKSIHESCSRLINEGGVDYDFEKVNPGTVWNVLKGIRSTEYPKVVPNDSGTIFFGIYSHGDYHPSHPIPTPSTTSTSNTTTTTTTTPTTRSQQNDPLHPTILPPPINPYNHEWFAHMPYPIQSQELAEEMLSFVSTVGASCEKFHTPERYLYATQLRSILVHLFSNQPNRPIIGLLNFCFSGGMIEFMRQPFARDYCGANNWPLFLMSASQSNHPALVGGLWSDFFSLFSNEIKTLNNKQIQQSSNILNDNISHHNNHNHNEQQKHEQQEQQEQEQQQLLFENCLENIKHRLRKRTLSSNNVFIYPSTSCSPPSSTSPLATSLTTTSSSSQQQQQQQQIPILTLKQFFLSVRSLYFQNCSYELHGHVISRVFAGRKTQVWSCFSVDILPMLSNGENGEPNYQQLQELQQKYRKKGITIWYSNQWGVVEANLVESVKEARKYIAIPDAVYGEYSGICDMPISILVSNNNNHNNNNSLDVK